MSVHKHEYLSGRRAQPVGRHAGVAHGLTRSMQPRVLAPAAGLALAASSALAMLGGHGPGRMVLHTLLLLPLAVLVVGAARCASLARSQSLRRPSASRPAAGHPNFRLTPPTPRAGSRRTSAVSVLALRK